MGGGATLRPLSFMLNDWEPAVHARNLMLLQLFFYSRDLLEAGLGGDINKGMGALGIDRGSESTRVQGEHRASSATRDEKVKGNPNHAAAAHSVPPGGGSCGGAFAQRIGVIFCAMFNTYIDPDVLAIVQGVAGRLAASAASPAEWASTELGQIVHFADDRSQARIRGIFALYADGSLQGRRSAARLKRERAAVVEKGIDCIYLGSSMIMSRSWGLASFRQGDYAAAYSNLRQKCEVACWDCTFCCTLFDVLAHLATNGNDATLVDRRYTILCCRT